MPDSPSLRTSRRRVLAVSTSLGALALGTTACDLVAPDPEPAEVDPSASGTSPSAAPDPDEDADEQLVARVADEVSRTLAVVEAAGRGRPQVRRSLRDLGRTHRAHLAELSDSPTRARRVRVGGDEGAAVRRVRSAEQQLQRRLARAAVDARSGPLAALLASMGAAIAQQLASGALA